MNTNRESVAYRSFRYFEFKAGGVRKVTTGMLDQSPTPPPSGDPAGNVSVLMTANGVQASLTGEGSEGGD